MGIVAGVIMGLVFRVNYFGSVWWCGLVVLLFVIGYLKPRITFVIIMLVAGMILAFFRVSSELRDESYIRQFYGQTILLTGTVNGDPETDEAGTKLKLVELKFGETEIGANGSIYMSIKENTAIERGDTVVVSGKLAEGFGTYVGYMYRPVVKKILKPEPGNWVLRLRNWFAERIKNLVPEPEVNLGLSYLLGMNVGLPNKLDENLRAVGLTHIVVASGAHLSILVEVARRIFGKTSRFVGLLFSLIFVLFFMAMIGWTPSIMRAGIMTILTLVAWYTGRKIAPWRLILMVAAFTLMLSPNYIFNLGWLLSFASYGGIMILGPGLCKFFYGEKKPGFVGATILTTMAATLMTLPIILYYYGQVSLISVVANLLILPTLPYAMGLVFLSGVMMGVPIVETAVGFVATKMLDFHIMIVEFFGGMRQFLVKMEPYQGWVWGIYGVIGLVVVGVWLKKLWRSGHFTFEA